MSMLDDRGVVVCQMEEGWEVWRRNFLAKKLLRSGFANAIVFCRNQRLWRGLRSLRGWSLRGVRMRRTEQRLGVGRRHYQRLLLRKCFSALLRFHSLAQQSLQEWRHRHLCAKGLGSWVRCLQELQEQSEALSLGAQVFERKVNQIFFSSLRQLHSKQSDENDRKDLADIFRTLAALKIGMSRLRQAQDCSSCSSMTRARKLLLQRHLLHKRRELLLRTVHLLCNRVRVKRIRFLRLLGQGGEAAHRSLGQWQFYISGLIDRRALLCTADIFSARQNLRKTLRMECFFCVVHAHLSSLSHRSIDGECGLSDSPKVSHSRDEQVQRAVGADALSPEVEITSRSETFDPRQISGF